jgi:hypothetical protein
MTKKNAAAQKELPVFDLINEYNAETAKRYEQLEKYAKDVTEAQALFNALNYRYEEAVKAAVIEGKDGKEAEELSEQLDAAERKLKNAKRMQLAAQQLNSRKVTAEHILQGLAAYKASYDSEVIKPSEKELRKAKEAYINAELEHMRKIKHFEDEVNAAYLTVKPNTIGGAPFSVGFGTYDNRAHKTITEQDVRELRQGKKPSSLAPRRQPVVIDGVTQFVPLEEDLEEGSVN